jgi:hypothetical protein
MNVRAAVLVLLAAAPAGAAEIALEAHAGYLDLTGARRSAEAVFGGTSGGPLVGVGARAGLGQHLFARLSVEHFQRSGERVFVADASSPVFRLGHPLSLSLTPVYADLGLQAGLDAALRPYAGIGAGAVLYHEESTVGGDTTVDSRTRGSARLFAGATVGRGPLRFGAEIAYARTPSTLGLGGVSRVYGETDLGSASIAANVAFRP